MPLSRRTQRRKNLLFNQLAELEGEPQEAEDLTGDGSDNASADLEIAPIAADRSAAPLSISDQPANLVVRLSARQPVCGTASSGDATSHRPQELQEIQEISDELDVPTRPEFEEPEVPVPVTPEVAARFESDRRLMEGAKQGDGEAFGKLVEQYQKSVHSYLRARLLRSGDAEDLTQEVFLRMYAARARFDSASLVQPFLMGIARNVLREHGRSAKRRKEVIWTEICLELEAESPPEDSAYEAFAAHLPRCLKGLTPTAQQALEMHYRQRMRHAAIGQTLRRSVGAVKLLLFRARKALKKCLDLSMGGVSHD